MNKKTKVLADSKTSITPQPKFQNIDELQSMKNQVIEEMYSTTNENHKETFTRFIHRLENRQIEIAEDYYWTNGSLPDDSIIYFKPKPQIQNQEPLGLKIDEWNDLEIRIGIDKVTFRKISSNATREKLLSRLNWDNKNIKIEALRILAKGSLRKSDFIKYNEQNAKIVINKYETPASQSIKNGLSDLRDDLYSLFPSLGGIDPIEYNRKDKRWSTPIKIILTDGEEKRVETEIKYKYGLGFKGMREGTYNPEFRDPVDTYQDNRSSIQDKSSKYLPDDEQEDDNGY